MKKTLQDQYLLIKEGKGHVGVFLTEAKRQFPNIVRNAATLDEAVASLKSKNIISENIFSVMPAIMDRPKKESYETAFENFLAEARKENEDEKVKAEEKKVSKPVEEDLSHNFDYSDEKNPDNLIFDQIMMGYYAELKDPKNADKTMQQLKDIVFKNLQKDPIYYTKDGQFGVKDLGYTTEAPGLGEPKEPKGKYKSSGYGDLNEGLFSSKPLGEVKGAKKDIKKAIITFLKKNTNLKSIEGLTDKDLLKALEGFARHGKSETASNANKIAHDLYKTAKPLFETDEPVDPLEGLDDKLISGLRDEGVSISVIRSIAKLGGNEGLKKELDDRKGGNKGKVNDVRNMSWTKGFTEEEQILREVIREMINAELEEAYQLVNINPVKEDLRESVEKDLADINKEAEHEVLQAKLDKIDDLIDHRRSKLGKLDEDEDMKALTDKKKVKELEKDIKKLEIARKKIEKMMSKFKGKKKEVIDEMEDDVDIAPEYIEDADQRQDAGQKIDSIVSTYTNMPSDESNDLENYLEDREDNY